MGKNAQNITHRRQPAASNLSKERNGVAGNGILHSMQYTDCVDACPMNCLAGGPNFSAINSDECIDCSMRAPNAR
jgi:NAD-dependent dihydropyrimidine dehydrogenase PreA subunit